MARLGRRDVVGSRDERLLLQFSRSEETTSYEVRR